MTCVARLDPFKTEFDLTTKIKMTYFIRLDLIELVRFNNRKLK